jgi:hypothetical protein
LYDNQIGGKVSEDIWEVSLNMTIDHLGEVLFDHLYDSASPSEREVLMVLSKEYKPVDSSSVTKEIKKFKNEAVNKYLNRLVLKKLLVRKERGIFAFPDRMFREYIFRKS